MANKVVFTFIAQDKFNRVVQRMRSLTDRATQSIRGMGEMARRTAQRMDALAQKVGKVGSKLRKVGQDISVKLSTAAAAGTAIFIRNFDKQAVAVAKVENAIKATGSAAGLTLRQLTDEATRLQGNTLFGDEDILNNATAQLLTFTNISQEQFLKTQQAALNLAAMLDGDLKSASIQLGKALNDPVANLSALSRSGIQFSKRQKDVVKGLWEAGRQADAQRVILRELERQYGGTAEAAARAGAGPFKQTSNAVGDVTEEIGAIMADILLPFVKWIKRSSEGFAELSPWVKKTIAVAILLATVLGPVVIALGAILAVIPMISAGLGALGAVAAVLASPFLLIPAAIAAVVAAGVWLYKEFEVVREVVDAVAGAITAAFDNAVAGVKSAIAAVTGVFNKAMEMRDKAQSFVTGKVADVQNFFGFGEEEKPPAATATSRTDVNVNMRAPEGAVESVKTSTRGNVPGMNVGVNMATTGP